jgi:hypothetical protein
MRETLIMRRNYPSDPELQPIKGVFVFKGEGEESASKALELLKSMRFEVLSSLENRVTIKASRGRLQEIKRCWLSNDQENNLSVLLNQQVTQIIIGGNVN